MGKHLFFGCGTGRCGLGTLHEIIDAQAGASSTFHTNRFLPWEGDDALLGYHAREILDFPGTVVGDVAPWWLSHAEKLIHFYDAKIVYMANGRDESVEGHLKLRFDHWSAYPPGNNPPCVMWVRALPKFKRESRRASAEAAWEHFEKLAKNLVEEYPANVRGIPVNDLNYEGDQIRLLEWLGVEKPKAVKVGDYPLYKGFR